MPTLSATADDELARPVEDAWDQFQGVAEAESSAGFACCLADDSHWDGIEADARRRVGHRYPGRKHASIAAIVIGAAYDLEDALFQVHPAASCAAVAIFWKSWQIQQHIARFCARLVKSETARELVGGGDPAGEIERARWFVLGQLGAFAAMLGPAVKAEVPACDQERVKVPTPTVPNPNAAEALAAKTQDQESSATTRRRARAETVAKIIRELNRLKPQLFEDAGEYAKLEAQHPEFLCFQIAREQFPPQGETPGHSGIAAPHSPRSGTCSGPSRSETGNHPGRLEGSQAGGVSPPAGD
jgi:hypothetical protein